jgi:small GTP-binding protein
MNRPFVLDQPKVIFLGESRVGKTSIIGRHVHSSEAPVPSSTIGCVYTMINVTTHGRTMPMQVWDTAGQEVYRSLVPIYVRGARLAVLVFDVTEPASLAALDEWIEVLKSTVPHETPIFAVANKIDLTENRIPDDDIDAFIRPRNLTLFKTSAKNGYGINDLFEAAAESISRDPVPLEVREFQDAANADRRRCCRQ